MGSFTHTTVRHLTAMNVAAIEANRDNLGVTKLGKTVVTFAGNPEQVWARIGDLQSDLPPADSEQSHRNSLNAVRRKLVASVDAHRVGDPWDTKHVSVEHVEFDDADAPDLHRGQTVDIRVWKGSNERGSVYGTQRGIVDSATPQSVTVKRTGVVGGYIAVGPLQVTPVAPEDMPATDDAQADAIVAEIETDHITRLEQEWKDARAELDAAPSDSATTREQDAHDRLADAKNDANQCLTVGCRKEAIIFAHCPEHREPDLEAFQATDDPEPSDIVTDTMVVDFKTLADQSAPVALPTPEQVADATGGTIVAQVGEETVIRVPEYAMKDRVVVLRGQWAGKPGTVVGLPSPGIIRVHVDGDSHLFTQIRVTDVRPETPVSAILAAVAPSIELGDRVRYTDDGATTYGDMGTVVPDPGTNTPHITGTPVWVRWDSEGTTLQAYGAGELVVITKLRDVTQVTDISQVKATVAANLTSQSRIVDAWGRVHAPARIDRRPRPGVRQVLVKYSDGDTQSFAPDDAVMVLRTPGQD